MLLLLLVGFIFFSLIDNSFILLAFLSYLFYLKITYNSIDKLLLLIRLMLLILIITAYYKVLFISYPECMESVILNEYLYAKCVSLKLSFLVSIVLSTLMLFYHFTFMKIIEKSIGIKISKFI